MDTDCHGRPMRAYDAARRAGHGETRRSMNLRSLIYLPLGAVRRPTLTVSQSPRAQPDPGASRLSRISTMIPPSQASYLSTILPQARVQVALGVEPLPVALQELDAMLQRCITCVTRPQTVPVGHSGQVCLPILGSPIVKCGISSFMTFGGADVSLSC